MAKNKIRFPFPYELPEFGECLVDYEDHLKNVPSKCDTISEVEASLLKDAIEEVLLTLPERERRVIKERFLKDKTLKEVGQKFNITRERIRKIELRGLRKLRDPSRSDILRQFWILYPEYDEEIKRKEKSKKRKDRYHKNKNEAEIQRSLLLKLTWEKRGEIETLSMEIKDKVERREFIKEKLEEQELLVWWNDQMWHIRDSIDYKLPAKEFTGQCRCRDWNCKYHVKFDEVEVLCCQCLTKFHMRNTKCQWKSFT